MRALLIFLALFGTSLSHAYQHPKLTVKGKVVNFNDKNVEVRHESGKISKIDRKYFKTLEPLKQDQEISVEIDKK